MSILQGREHQHQPVHSLETPRGFTGFQGVAHTLRPDPDPRAGKCLAELRGAGIVSGERGVGYPLTKAGKDLLASLTPLLNGATVQAPRTQS